MIDGYAYAHACTYLYTPLFPFSASLIITIPFENAIDRASENNAEAETLRKEYVAKTNTLLEKLGEQRKKLDSLLQEFRTLASL